MDLWSSIFLFEAILAPKMILKPTWLFFLRHPVYFFNTLLRGTAERLKIDKTELSLKQIAEDAKVSYNKENARQIPEKTKIRQMKVIEYFERQVKKFDLKDFL